ncbi:MAG TPA: hypothetical protein VMZ71_16535 [Gemmataceae bacterium]|nr:hypothetical protein [Gemmataceae bacterium]
MSKPRPCACCNAPLEPAQEFRFLVESETLDAPAYLAAIRRMPAANGRPVPVCEACQAKLAAPRLVRAGVAAAVKILSIGWVMTTLLAPRG